MPREKFQTLTEPMFYILLCFGKECCGIDVMEKISSITNGRVRVGAGTLYHLLDEFAEAGFIRETKAEGRRRSYLLTDLGRSRLAQEHQRLLSQISDYETMLKEGI